jgi:chromosome segregation ATPase
MGWLSWLQGVESHLFTLAARGVTDLRVDLHEDVERTADELQQRHAVTAACRESLRRACADLLRIESRVAALEDGIRTATLEGDAASAVHRAVELEEARAALAEARVRVVHLQRACLNHQDELTRLESHLADLQARLTPC